MLDRRTLLAVSLGALVLPALSGARAETVDMLRLMAPGALPDIVLGSADAKVTIVEYASMTCPHCARFNHDTLPALKARYIDSGKVKYIFREFPLDAVAAGAAVLARCRGADKFYAMIDLLFSQQQVWGAADDPVSALQKLAAQTGLSASQFDACLSDQAALDKVVAERTKAASQYGVDSTPTFFVNGEKVSGELSIDDLAKMIDPKL